MPDITSQIAFPCSWKFSNRDNAVKYLTHEYQGIIYNETTDVFEYRGFSFNYFLAGISLQIGERSSDKELTGSYLLIEKDTGQWLFSYGDKEERWRDFLESIKSKSEIQTYYKRSKTLWGSVLNLLGFWTPTHQSKTKSPNIGAPQENI